jgi:hypothetical protein
LQKYKIKYKKNKHQKAFQEDLVARFLHLSTGFGGGKTYALCMKALLLSMLNAPHAGGIVCPDFQEFKKDVLPEMENILEASGIPYKYHKTEHYFKFPWSKGKLFVVSADKKIRGPNWAYALINEVTLIPLMKYKEVIGRVRIKGAKFPQICSVGTPEGYASEYYEYFIEDPPQLMKDKLRIIYGATDDNADNLHEFYLENLESAYDKKMIQTFRDGLWVNMADNLFYYSYNPRINHDETIVRTDWDQFHISMDFNVDPFCATVWGYDGYSLSGIEQIELKGSEGFRTENMIQAMVARGYKPHNTIIYPDPAGRARSTKGLPDVTILRNAGYEVRAKAAAPSFRARQLNVNNLLDKKLITFHPIKCKGIKKDLEAVSQNILTLEKLKDNPALTHFSDGLDYMCDILFPFSGNAKSTSTTRIR